METPDLSRLGKFILCGIDDDDVIGVQIRADYIDEALEMMCHLLDSIREDIGFKGSQNQFADYVRNTLKKFYRSAEFLDRVDLGGKNYA